MIHNKRNALTNSLKGYVKVNWGSPFIAGFVLLMLSAVVCLLAGLSSMANNLSVYAFYALVIGFVLQLIYWLRKGSDKIGAI
jgi:hypothetical protein